MVNELWSDYTVKVQCCHYNEQGIHVYITWKSVHDTMFPGKEVYSDLHMKACSIFFLKKK